MFLGVLLLLNTCGLTSLGLFLIWVWLFGCGLLALYFVCFG